PPRRGEISAERSRLAIPSVRLEDRQIPAGSCAGKYYGREFIMIILYSGPYENLSFRQQRAVHKLTAQRYVEDVYRLGQYLKEWEGLAPGTSEYERAYTARYEQIEQALGEVDEHTSVTAILLSNLCGEWEALASMRTIWGQRAHVPVSCSIGC